MQRVPVEERRQLDPSVGRLSRHFLTSQNPRAVLRLALRVIEPPIPARLITPVRCAAA